jgi:serine protease Do
MSMRIILLILAVFSFIPSAQAFDRQKMLESFFSSVMVRGYKADGNLAYGSGVVVGESKVLTNCHIFRKTTQPWISRGEESYSVVSVQADRWHDLCLLTTDNLPFKPVILGKGNLLKKGQEVISIGHSSGIPTPLTSIGSVKSLYPMDGGNIIRNTARFALGASGSGLYDGEGRLVGISTFKTVGDIAYYYALPVEWLAQLEKEKVETKFPITGDAFWESGGGKSPFFMQIAGPELQNDWGKLSEVANRWVKAEPDNSEAWYELGMANEKLGNQAEAEQAYLKSISLDASNTDSLFRIGMIASARGDAKGMHAINLALSDIDKSIAEEFSKTAGCSGAC